MSEDTELKPCPFCGGKATRRQEEFRHVSCENPRCDVVAEAGAFFGNEQEAIAAWNTRPGEQAAIAKAVEAERARCLGIIGYPRVHFPASYPDWLIWLIELDIRNGVEQPKRGE